MKLVIAKRSFEDGKPNETQQIWELHNGEAKLVYSASHETKAPEKIKDNDNARYVTPADGQDFMYALARMFRHSTHVATHFED